MAAKSGQKETPAPICRKRPRKGIRGEREFFTLHFSLFPTEKSVFRFDPSRIWTKASTSKPAGPLSQDTLSHGGSFFFRKEVFP
jgi:hypothetical protein